MVFGELALQQDVAWYLDGKGLLASSLSLAVVLMSTGWVLFRKLSESNKVAEYPLIPPHSYTFVCVGCLFFLFHAYSVWPYALVMYGVAARISPYQKRLETVKILLGKTFSGRFENLPLRFNLTGLGHIMWGLFLRLPLEVFLWYLDELFFPDYKNTEIKDPVFLLGQPRSGTTKFQDVLCEDKESFCSLKLYEMRFPFLTVQYSVDFLARIDKQYLGGSLLAFMEWSQLVYVLPESGERREMRRLRYDLQDEDDLIFVFHCMCHYLFLGLFPHPDLVKPLCQMKDLPQDTRKQFMTFHRKCVQKVLYRRGHGRRYLAKWVAGWNGLLDESKEYYPGGQYLTIVREPSAQMPSWLKLQGLLSQQISGNNMMENCPSVRAAIVELNKDWFEHQIAFCKSMSRRHQLYVLRYADFVKNISGGMRKAYNFLNIPIEEGSDFDIALRAHGEKQSSHRRTVIRQSESYLSDDEIEDSFPALLDEIEFDCNKD